jgi:hypothetical protein
MPSTLTTFAALMKTRYTPEAIINAAVRDRPRLSMLTKKSDWAGETYTQPIIYGLPRSTAFDIANARTVAATSNVTSAKFLVPPTTTYGAVQIGDLAMLTSKTTQGAFLDNKMAEVEGVIETIGQTLSAALWFGNNGVVSGRRLSISTNDITLTNLEDVYNWQVGDILTASSADGSGGSDALRVGSTAVTAVNRETGVITVASAAAITSFTNNDYLFRLGQFGGNSGNLAPAGFAQYVAATSSPGTFYSLARNTDPTFLAGCRIPSALTNGRSTAERIEILLTQMKGVYQVPVKPSFRVWLNPIDWQVLQTEMRSRGIQPMSDAGANFGFQYLTIIGGGTAVKVYADQDTPEGTAFVEDPSVWKWSDCTDFISPMADGDGPYGMQRLTSGSVAGYEVVMRAYGNQLCSGPGRNGRVILT